LSIILLSQEYGKMTFLSKKIINPVIK